MIALQIYRFEKIHLKRKYFVQGAAAHEQAGGMRRKSRAHQQLYVRAVLLCHYEGSDLEFSKHRG